MLFRTKEYNKIILNKDSIRLLWPDALIMTIFIWIQLFNPMVTTISYIGLSFYAMKNSKTAIKALSLGVILTFLNPGLFPGSNYSYFLRWVLLFSAAGRIYFNWLISYRTIPKWLVCLFIFSMASALSSLVNSYAIYVSLAKILVFFIGISTVLMGFEQTKKSPWGSWFFTLFIVILISSLPFLLYRKIGYYRYTYLFQGIFCHSQTYGVYMVIPTMWLTSFYFFNNQVKFIVKLTVFFSWITIFASNCRTAIFASLLAILLSTVIAFFKRADWKKKLFRVTKKPVFIILILVVLVLTIFNSAIISKRIKGFVYKDTFTNVFAEKSIYGVIEDSRGFLMERSWLNFKKHPWIGNGFGIASDRDIFSVRTLQYINIPVAASIEKGFIISTLMEEVGLLGLFIFLLFIFNLISPIIKFGDISSMWLFGTAFFISFGEMIFFSPGGLGMHIWIYLALAIHSCSNNT